MSRRMLTAVAVAKLRPGPTRMEVPDAGAPGLHLVVQPSGTKSWAMRFRRPNGKHYKLTLGPVDLTGEESDAELVLGSPLTLAGARRLALSLHHERALGRDVVEDRKAAKRRLAAERENTFAAAARRYVEEYARKRQRRWRDTATMLGLRPDAEGGLVVVPGGLAERWCERPLVEIDGDAVHELIKECSRKGVPGVPTRKTGTVDSRGLSMHRALSKMFSWLVQERVVPVNAMLGVSKPGQGDARDRVLTNAEVRWFWHACDEIGEPFGPLFRLMLLTGQRKSEVAHMTRAEVSEDGAMLSLPGSRTKNGKPQLVPLSTLARDTLAGARPIAGRAGYVFTTNGRTPVSGFSKAKRQLDAKMLAHARRDDPEATIPPWRLHDLRRTAATGMADIGIAPHVVEAVLNHISGTRAGVAGIYNRSAYAAEKRAALDRWADHLSGLVAGRASNVVPMRIA